MLDFVPKTECRRYRSGFDNYNITDTNPCKCKGDKKITNKVLEEIKVEKGIKKLFKNLFKNKKNVSRAEYIYRKPSKINAYLTVPRCSIPLCTPISQ